MSFPAHAPQFCEPDSLASELGHTDDQLGPHYYDQQPAPPRDLRLPPYSRRLAIPEDNLTVFIGVGRHAWNRAHNFHGRFLVYQGDDPHDYFWPVADCGVILIDYEPLAEHEALLLAVALRQAGAEEVIWSNLIANDTDYLIRGSHQ